MGNCLSCFKVPSPPSAHIQQISSEHKDETMELGDLFPPTGCLQTSPLTAIETHTNGNSKSGLGALSTFNKVGSDNCGSLPMTHNNLRTSRGTYARIPPLDRPKTSLGLNLTVDCKQQKDSSESKLNALFDMYKDPHEDIILADGIERLCEDLQLSPDEFKVLVLAWKLNAEQMCQFARQEFITGLKGMHVDSIRGIQARLPEIVQELTEDGELFKDLYRFTFRFGLDVGSGQRILPADMALVLWRLVFTIREPPLLVRWLKFLECHQHVRGIPRDTWNMFLNFAESIGDDLSAYDDTEAWPSLIDDFVEYENDQMNQNITKDDIIMKDNVDKE
ncbi:DCN1-like protein 3 [Neodiprion pinetum]|uniref:DCN1-like protein 3 n=1 Tax=Neodiprion pinetum TaxID=441929 RepID=UPI001EE0FC0F|nr:DCN1-like protein 3 [Neodiprion pinetum]XP_046470083.1 DCN1-like protein 3 [Neodiprion pinetum]XP_046604214.1 DCN1-like protein 3 [Neodiprion virginianus]XP_046604215.1 DCN1-like protein 3 [Neodiprion virginianus]